MKRGTDTLNKLQLETVNAGVVHLWLEGMFWKAYERSAYIFCRRVNDYKPYKKWIKAVGGEVVAIGFPTKAFDRMVDGRLSDSDGSVDVLLHPTFSSSIILSARLPDAITG